MQPDEFQKRLNNKVRSFSAELMNNTKWREVLQILSEEHATISYSTVWVDEFSNWESLDRIDLKREYVADGCLLGGPRLYRELKELHIAKNEKLRNPVTGAQEISNHKSQRILNRIYDIGKLPIVEKDDFYSICGYLD